jgi:nicotinate-nucleotide adenylyltransferase
MWFAGPAPEAPQPRRGSLAAGLHLERGMRVGVFGGSFNPAHEGHAHVAETARLRLGLDRVIWLVSPQNPLKDARHTAPLEKRMASARKIAHAPANIVSDFETRIGAVYTIDTLRALKARYPGVHFVWIMGGDSLRDFHRWRGWTDIFQQTPIAVVARPGTLIDSRFAPAARRYAHARLPSREGALLPTAATPAWIYLRAPLNAASSTAIRRGRDAAS